MVLRVLQARLLEVPRLVCPSPQRVLALAALSACILPALLIGATEGSAATAHSTVAQEVGPSGMGGIISSAIHPTNPDIMFMGIDVGGILKSTNGGGSWRHVNSGLALPDGDLGSLGIVDLAISTADPSVIFASTWSGLFRSTDTGVSWGRVVPLGTGFPGYDFFFSSVAADPGGQVVLAGTGDPFEGDPGVGLYRSTNGGQSFSKLSGTGLPSNALFNRLLIDPGSPPASRHVYAATQGGLYRSTNGGLTFTKISGPWPHEIIRDLAISASGGSTRIWLALQTTDARVGGVFHSANGTSWTDATGDIPFSKGGFTQYVTRILAHPTNASTAFLAMRDWDYEYGGLFRTTNGGTTWTEVTTPGMDLGWSTELDVFPETAAISLSSPNRVLVGAESQPILTDDGGDSWQQVGTRDNGNGTYTGRGVEITYVYDLAASSNPARRMYAGYEDAGLWRSDDGGASWRQLFWDVTVGSRTSDGCTEIHLHPTDGSELYAVSSTWSNGLREPGSGAWLLHSTDAGASWDNLTSSFSVRGRGAAAVDFSQPVASRNMLFAQYGVTIYRSTNGGASWGASASGIAAGDVTRIFVIAMDPQNPQRVFAGTFSAFGEIGSGGNLYRSDNGGASWTSLAAFPYDEVYTIALLGSPQRLFVGGGTYFGGTDDVRGGLLVSDDNGQTFTPVLEEPFVKSITALAGNPTHLITGSGASYIPGYEQVSGLYLSRDNGNTWERMKLEPPHTAILSLLSPPWAPGDLFVGTQGAGNSRLTLGHFRVFLANE